MELDGIWRMRDSVSLEPRINNGDDVIMLDDDDNIDWDRIPTTTLDTHQSFFDTNTFHSLSVTVAKPIEQEYTINDDEYTMYKPPDELARASWSVDNSPWTIDHPVGGIVTSTDQIKGVFTETQYDWQDEALVSSLNIPVHDRESREYLRDSDNVSIGFHNAFDYDIDRDGVTAAQRDIYIDHVASVKDGRCSDEDGCKVHTDGGET